MREEGTNARPPAKQETARGDLRRAKAKVVRWKPVEAWRIEVFA